MAGIMTISSIGVQQILPRTGTAWQNADPAPDQPNDRDGDDVAPASAPVRPVPAPGTGLIVDRVV